MDLKNLPALRALRERYLAASDSLREDYWNGRSLIEAYDETLGTRIGWKWESVLAELKGRGWTPPPGVEWIDWGCGTGQASRRFFSAFPEAVPEKLWLHDRSTAAARFAQENSFANLTTEIGLPSTYENRWVLLSHVLSELSERTEAELSQSLSRAAGVIWIEPGTPAMSHQLIAIRERLRDRFSIVAPCPHVGRCGLAGSPSDWCHFFAEVPSEAHQSARWRAIADTLGFDLRALPVSFLVLDRRPLEKERERGRLLGRPRVYKGYATALICRVGGVVEEKFLKRDKEGPFRSVKEGGFFVPIP